MRAIVDPDVCIGCILCAETCPDVFKMIDDKAVAYTDPVSEGIKDACRQAVQDCPVDAIRIEE